MSIFNKEGKPPISGGQMLEKPLEGEKEKNLQLKAKQLNKEKEYNKILKDFKESIRNLANVLPDTEDYDKKQEAFLSLLQDFGYTFLHFELGLNSDEEERFSKSMIKETIAEELRVLPIDMNLKAKIITRGAEETNSYTWFS